MNKNIKNGILIIVILMIIGAIIWLIYDTVKPVNGNTIDTNMIQSENDVNETNNIQGNEIDNDIIENNIGNNTQENELNEQSNKQTNETKNEQTSNQTVASKEERAIELVKKEWGEDDGVYFTNESIDNEGRYIVSVRNKNTTSLLAFYTVDVAKQLVTMQ